MAYPLDEVKKKIDPPTDLAETLLGDQPGKRQNLLPEGIYQDAGGVWRNDPPEKRQSLPPDGMAETMLNSPPDKRQTLLAEGFYQDTDGVWRNDQPGLDKAIESYGTPWVRDEIERKKTENPNKVSRDGYAADLEWRKQNAEAIRRKPRDQSEILAFADKLVQHGVSPDKAPGTAMEIDQILHPEKYVKDQNFSTDHGVYSVKDKQILPGSEPTPTAPPSGNVQPVKDPETGAVIGHYVDGKFVKAGTDPSAIPPVKLTPYMLESNTVRQRQIEQRLTELDRERSAGNKKKGADWWFPKSGNFDQERQKLENELEGVQAVLSGRPAAAPEPGRPTTEDRGQKPPPDMLSANEAAKASGQTTFYFGGKTYRVK
jgi:hypothetical protein